MKKSTCTTAAVVALAFVAAPATMSAQDGTGFSVDARGGIAIPASDMADVADLGPTIGASVRYRVHPRVDARIDGELDILSGLDETADGAATPDVELWRALAGVGVRILGAGSPVDVSAHLEGGLTSYNTAVFPDVVFDPQTGDPVGDFAETYPTVAGGLEVGYPVVNTMNLSADVFARGSWTMMFTDDAETAIFDEIRSGAGGFDQGTTVPVTLGVKLGF